MARSVSLQRVAIFGATAAMAQETGRLLAARGAELFLVGRDPRKLGAVADDLRTRGAGNVVAAVADLNDLTGHAELVARAAEALGRIDVVLIAHGLLGDQLESEASPAAAEVVMRTNFVGPALLAQAAANHLAAQRGGTLVAISSVAGDRGRGSNYVYGAAKGGFSVFLSGLRNRMHRANVSVVTVKPGFVDTPMTAHVPKNLLFTSAATVAGAIVRAVERRRDVVYVPAFWRLVMAVIRAIPERVFKRLSM